MRDVAKPTPEQIAWAECEVGVIIHLDLQVFEPTFRFRKQWGYQPSTSIFDPKELDTDQWIKVAKNTGAKYAVLVVKHCSGFCLWPSKASDYNLRSTPYKNGKGDVFGEFIASCKKFDIHPGVYYSTICNAKELYDLLANQVQDLKSDAFKNYCILVENQLRELWTEYGELFEIWFDGGHIPNGPDIPKMLKEYQPRAICFQGPPEWHSNLRWVGNEKGVAPIPCWSTIDDYGHYDGTKKIKKKNRGDPEGTYWMSAETDTPNRFLQWFWYKNQDKFIKSVSELVRAYYTSVGRNTNLLLGMVIDDRGLVPKRDTEVFEQFGREIQARFENPIAETQGEARELTLTLSRPQLVNQVVLMEDISQGHTVRGYTIEGSRNNNWITLCKGECIGHKAIQIFKQLEVDILKLTCVNVIKTPIIRKFAVFNVEPLPKKPKILKRFGRLVRIIRSLKTIIM
jgi:alpha-L-fucosidase